MGGSARSEKRLARVHARRLVCFALGGLVELGRGSPAMPPAPFPPHGFGPFDSDFDPFEDDQDSSVLIPLD